MDNAIKWWQDWLDSLSTKGGNIFLMFISLMGLMAFVHHISQHTTDASLVSAAHDMMVGFGAALLAVLSGSSSKQQMVDRVEAASGAGGGSRVDVAKVDTVNVTSGASGATGGDHDDDSPGDAMISLPFAVIVVAATWISAAAMTYGILKTKLDILMNRMEKLEDGHVPRMEYEGRHVDITNRLARIEQKIDARTKPAPIIDIDARREL